MSTETIKEFLARHTAERDEIMAQHDRDHAAIRATRNSEADHATHIKNVSDHVKWLEAKLTPTPPPKRVPKKRIKS